MARRRCCQKKKKTTHQRAFRRHDRQSALTFAAAGPTPRQCPQLVLAVSKVASLAEPAAARLPPADSEFFLVRGEMMSRSTGARIRLFGSAFLQYQRKVLLRHAPAALHQTSSYLKQMRVFAFSALPRKGRGGAPPLLRRCGSPLPSLLPPTPPTLPRCCRSSASSGGSCTVAPAATSASCARKGSILSPATGSDAAGKFSADAASSGKNKSRRSGHAG